MSFVVDVPCPQHLVSSALRRSMYCFVKTDSVLDVKALLPKRSSETWELRTWNDSDTCVAFCKPIDLPVEERLSKCCCDREVLLSGGGLVGPRCRTGKGR